MYKWIGPNGSVVPDEVIDASQPNVLVFNPALFGDEGPYFCRAFINISGIIYDVNSTAAVLTSKLVISKLCLPVHSYMYICDRISIQIQILL